MILQSGISNSKLLYRMIKLPILTLLTLLILAVACENTEDFEFPLVFTGEVTDVSDTSALFTAKLSSFGSLPVSEAGFIWGLHPDDNNGLKLKITGNLTKVYSIKTDEKLLPGKTYYVRAYVQTKTATSYGREVSFKTPEMPVQKGSWSQIHAEPEFWGNNESVRTSFTINGTTYLVLNRGKIYSYNASSDNLKYEITGEVVHTACFSVVKDNKAYIFSGNGFYLFDPAEKSFSGLAILPGETRWGISGFVIDDNIYIGLGTVGIHNYTKEFMRYNIPSDSWQNIASFPGDYRANGFSFSLRNRGYVGGGWNDIRWPYPMFNDLWCYIPETGEWVKKESFPLQVNGGITGLGTEQSGYGYYWGKFYEYNPVFDIWERMADLESVNVVNYPHLFTAGGKIFMMELKDDLGVIRFNLWSYEK